MQTEQKDILNTQLNVENNHNSDSSLKKDKGEQIYRAKRLENSPFNIVNKEDKFYLTLGNYLLSPAMQTEEGIREYLEGHKWEIISSLILLVHERAMEDYERKQKVEKLTGVS